MMTLYWSEKSRAERALWMLEEVDQPYQLEAIDIRAEDRHDSAAFLDASPLGKVPALRDGEAVVADSAAIALYLADRYASGRLAPAPDDPERGAFLYWLFYTPSAIEPAMAEKFGGLEPNPAAYPWGSFDKMVAALTKRMTGREWVVGDRFTMADLMLASAARFLVQFGLLQPEPAIAAFVDRCYARPAAKRAQEREASATA